MCAVRFPLNAIDAFLHRPVINLTHAAAELSDQGAVSRKLLP
jgi:hypothetical protein